MYEQKGTIFPCKQRALQAHIATSCILSFICISKNKATSSPGGLEFQKRSSTSFPVLICPFISRAQVRILIREVAFPQILKLKVAQASIKVTTLIPVQL